MREPRWPTLEEVLVAHERQIARFGGPAGIRDAGALESALDRPRNKFAYGEIELASLAAAYAFGIARNHPSIDGNKRAAFVAMMLFLRLNGVHFAPMPARRRSRSSASPPARSRRTVSPAGSGTIFRQRRSSAGRIASARLAPGVAHRILEAA